MPPINTILLLNLIFTCLLRPPHRHPLPHHPPPPHRYPILTPLRPPPTLWGQTNRSTTPRRSEMFPEG